MMSIHKKNGIATATLVAVAAGWASPVEAQEIAEPDLDALVARVQKEEEEAADRGDVLDEVTVTGRFVSSSQKLVNERMSDAFATDLLGADTISRLGDSTVSAALRRVPGLTLVQDKVGHMII